MENMDKGLTVPKWALINWPKIPQMHQNLSAQIVCSSPKVWDFDGKRLHWTFVVPEQLYEKIIIIKKVLHMERKKSELSLHTH
jgi:hypothetical protein